MLINFQITDVSFTKTDDSFTTAATFIDINRVSCAVTDITSSFVLTISNNGLDFSVKEVVVIVTNAACFDCDLAAGTCERKVNGGGGRCCD